MEWRAPPAGSGCVTIKAIVVESSELWYEGGEPLKKVLCEEVPQTDDTQPNALEQCCACHEAKYEVWKMEF